MVIDEIDIIHMIGRPSAEVTLQVGIVVERPDHNTILADRLALIPIVDLLVERCVLIGEQSTSVCNSDNLERKSKK